MRFNSPRLASEKRVQGLPWGLIPFIDGKPLIIASCVLSITIILEFLQLIHPKFLEAIRSTTIGRTIIGSNFNWKDFMFYLLGWGLGIMWMAGIKRIAKTN